VHSLNYNYQIMATITTMEEALTYAATKLSYESLKTEQKEAVKAFVEGNDVFVSLLTGFGKSLCFALILEAIAAPIRAGTETTVKVGSTQPHKPTRLSSIVAITLRDFWHSGIHETC